MSQTMSFHRRRLLQPPPLTPALLHRLLRKQSAQLCPLQV
nr:MAG TPA: hypothetical protein [Caudoviricetes sp.]